MNHHAFKSLIISFLLLNSFHLFANENTAIKAQHIVSQQALKETSTTALEEEEEQKYYAIEVILFRHKNAPNNTELWAKADELDATDSLQQTFFANYKISQQQLIIEDKSNLFPLLPEIAQLQEKSQTIRYAPEYQLLSYFGWIQKGLPKEQAKPVQLIFDEQNDQLKGEITLHLSRYLHTKIHLESIEKVCRMIKDEKQDEIKIQVQTTDTTPEEDNSENTADTSNIPEKPQYDCQMEKILFQQQRKMRSRELHYIDHPVFGLLVEITPLEKQQIQALPKIDDSLIESTDNLIPEEDNSEPEQNNRALQGEL